jgi:type VI secretion system protein ImpH
MKLRTPLEKLAAAPQKFRFDAAVRLLLAAAGAARTEETLTDDQVRFHAPAALGQPTAEVTAATLPRDGIPGRLSTTVIGLTGASAVMPRWYTELVAQSVRQRARGLGDFFDLLAQRLIDAFAGAAIKYRLHRSSEAAALNGLAQEPIGAGLLALTGYGTAHLADRLAAGADPLRHYAGFFSARPRSADRLASMVSDYLGRRVEIQEFAGAWLTIAPDQQSRLPRGRGPGAFHALGVDAAIGTRAWDQQARFILRVGPLNRAEFEALLPDRGALPALVSLVRAYVGWEADFAVNLVLAAPEIPELRMAGPDVTAPPRLGWTTWLPSTTGQLTGRRFADEAVFSATMVEALAP